MARFRGSVQGNRGEATRLGGSAGMTAKVDGWDVGVEVEAGDDDGSDVFRVYATGGSNHRVSERFVAEIKKGEIHTPGSIAIVLSVQTARGTVPVTGEQAGKLIDALASLLDGKPIANGEDLREAVEALITVNPSYSDLLPAAADFEEQEEA